MAVLTPPDGAALATIPAARYGVQVNTGTASSPTWTFVNGLTNFEPKFDPKMEDDTDITSGGWESQATVGNAFTIDFEGLVKGTVVSDAFTPDPGMWALKTASQQGGGTASNVHMRYWRYDNVDEAFEFRAAVKATLKGGKPNELQKFSGSLVGKGKPTAITKPTAA